MKGSLYDNIYIYIHPVLVLISIGGARIFIIVFQGAHDEKV